MSVGLCKGMGSDGVFCLVLSLFCSTPPECRDMASAPDVKKKQTNKQTKKKRFGERVLYKVFISACWDGCLLPAKCFCVWGCVGMYIYGMHVW